MDVRRKWRVAVIILVILAGIIVLAWISFQWEQTTSRSERHDVTYTIRLSVNTTIENVTLYLPVPEQDGTPILAGSFVNRTGYGVPADWNITIIPVEGRQMLSIRAPLIEPVYVGYPIPAEPGKTPDRTPVRPATAFSPETPVLVPVELITLESRALAIDTGNPAGHEPVFRPQGDYTPVQGTSPVVSGTVSSYRVPVYLNYSAGGPVTVELFMSIEGVNSIWKGGWIFNRYSDTVSLVLGNGTRGWVEAEGTLIAGEGVSW